MGTYEQALRGSRTAPAGKMPDDQKMALLLDCSLQIICGAYSPKLVWEGAQKKGLSSRQVQELVLAQDLRALDDLQFYE